MDRKGAGSRWTSAMGLVALVLPTVFVLRSMRPLATTPQPVTLA